MINVEQMLTPAPEDAARFVKAPEVEELKIGNQVRVTDTSMPRCRVFFFTGPPLKITSFSR